MQIYNNKCKGGDKVENRLILPSASGLLDCFNTRLTLYYKKESMCCLQSDCDNLLLLALFSFFYKYISKNNCDPFCHYTFKMSDFKRYAGYCGGGKSKDLCAELIKLSEVGYVWEYSPEEKIFDISFSDTRTFATVSSKYFGKIIEYMRSFHSLKNKWGNKIILKGKSTYSSAVYTSIIRERNKSAVEICIELVKVIERRGHLDLEKGQTAHISIPTLISRCPSLSRQLKEKEGKEQNRIVKTAIYKGIELMKIHTAVYESFEGLEFLLPENIRVKGEDLINIKYIRRNV